MLESALEAKCRVYAVSHGCLFLKNIGTRGFPDRTVIGPTGKVIFIEFKRPDGSGRLSKLQEHYLAELERRSAIGVVVDSFQQFIKVIENYL